MFAGHAPASNLWKSRFSAVSAGRCPVSFVHDQRRIDGNLAVLAGERGDRVDDARVILGDADVEQAAVGVNGRHTGLAFFTPREIEPNEVHTPYPAGAAP